MLFEELRNNSPSCSDPDDTKGKVSACERQGRSGSGGRGTAESEAGLASVPRMSRTCDGTGTAADRWRRPDSGPA